MSSLHLLNMQGISHSKRLTILFVSSILFRHSQFHFRFQEIAGALESSLTLPITRGRFSSRCIPPDPPSPVVCKICSALV